MLFMEIIVVYLDSHTKHKTQNTLGRINAVFINIKPSCA